MVGMLVSEEMALDIVLTSYDDCISYSDIIEDIREGTNIYTMPRSMFEITAGYELADLIIDIEQAIRKGA